MSLTPAAAIQLLKNEMVEKLNSSPTLAPKIGGRIYTLISPDDPELYQKYSKLPFIGIHFPEPTRGAGAYFGSQQVDENLRPRVYIYHENSGDSGQRTFDDLLEIADAAISTLNYYLDFNSALEIFEALAFDFTGPEGAATVEFPYAARVYFTMEYQRIFQEVAV